MVDDHPPQQRFPCGVFLHGAHWFLEDAADSACCELWQAQDEWKRNTSKIPTFAFVFAQKGRDPFKCISESVKDMRMIQ